jgi:hypothetical protein
MTTAVLSLIFYFIQDGLHNENLYASFFFGLWVLWQLTILHFLMPLTTVLIIKSEGDKECMAEYISRKIVVS